MQEALAKVRELIRSLHQGLVGGWTDLGLQYWFRSWRTCMLYRYFVDVHIYIYTYIHTYIHTDRQTDRQTDRHTYIHI